MPKLFACPKHCHSRSRRIRVLAWQNTPGSGILLAILGRFEGEGHVVSICAFYRFHRDLGDAGAVRKWSGSHTHLAIPTGKPRWPPSISGTGTDREMETQ